MSYRKMTEDRSAFELAFYQKILRTGLHRGDGEIRIVEAGQDDQRHHLHMRADTGDGAESLAVGQRQVQQYHVESPDGKLIAGVAQRSGISDAESISLFHQEFADQTGIARVVLDQEDPDGPLLGHAILRSIR